jgi:ABC-type lipoprotein export system ATPase subunit
MYTQLNIRAPDIPAFESLNRPTWSDQSDWSDLFEPIKSSPSQSNPVQPNPTKSSHPLPSGKGIGKQTACPPNRLPDHQSAFDGGGWRRRVKFLAIFDHLYALRFTRYVPPFSYRPEPNFPQINPMPSSAPLLTLSAITKRYESPGNATSLTVLDNVSLQVERGQSLAIVGPSGSGKSTLLQIIGTLDRPTGGTVQLDGQDLNQLNDVELAAVRNRKLGFVFQFHYLLPQCTVLENVLVPTLAKVKQLPPLPGERAGVRGNEASTGQKGTEITSIEPAEARANRLLKRVGLAERVNHRPGELSGGERQRVAVVRALINQPWLLLADEPTGSLDHASAQQLGQLLVELNREEGVTLIVVTHARELAAKMGKQFELKDGKLNQNAKPNVES